MYIRQYINITIYDMCGWMLCLLKDITLSGSINGTKQ